MLSWVLQLSGEAGIKHIQIHGLRSEDARGLPHLDPINSLGYGISCVAVWLIVLTVLTSIVVTYIVPCLMTMGTRLAFSSTIQQAQPPIIIYTQPGPDSTSWQCKNDNNFKDSV